MDRVRQSTFWKWQIIWVSRIQIAYCTVTRDERKAGWGQIVKILLAHASEVIRGILVKECTESQKIQLCDEEF